MLPSSSLVAFFEAWTCRYRTHEFLCFTCTGCVSVGPGREEGLSCLARTVWFRIHAVCSEAQTGGAQQVGGMSPGSPCFPQSLQSGLCCVRPQMAEQHLANSRRLPATGGMLRVAQKEKCSLASSGSPPPRQVERGHTSHPTDEADFWASQWPPLFVQGIHPPTSGLLFLA